MIFNILCLIFILIVFYSIFYQLKVYIIYKKNKKIKVPKASGIFVGKDILNSNGLEKLYITEKNGYSKNYYDVERNVIYLSSDVYQEENLSSIIISLFQTVKAISVKDKDLHREKNKLRISDYLNKLFFFLFIIGLCYYSVDTMAISLVVIVINIIFKYNYINDYSNIIDKNIKLVKKEYKLSKENVDILENSLNDLVFNELSLHIFNNRY